MGVINSLSFPDDALTPVCEKCGVHLCWDISQKEYEDDKLFWENWQCKDCNPNYHFGKKRDYNEEAEELGRLLEFSKQSGVPIIISTQKRG